MINPHPQPGQRDPEPELDKAVARRAASRQRKQRQGRRTAWFGLGMFGLLGWSVAVPTLLGIAAGIWLDRRWPGQVSWTLTLLVAGAALGCLNAWYWMNEENKRD